ncbi:MAG: L,D-transpeptidase family protein [Pseudomonadota bacterium]|nr:L,D-transpeptidase family protein [Pseudomonadota bacterium]
MNVFVKPTGHLIADGKQFRCALGRGGVTTNKKEGDGATPTGKFPFRSLLFRSDRYAPPKTRLSKSIILPEDGWCDEPSDPNYNKPVRVPYEASHEKLWRDDGLYDIVVVLGHNDQPVVPYLGSAIFLHCAKPDYRPTEGCISVLPNDLLNVLELIGPNDNLIIST